jgi:hypothetical protein
MKLRTTRLNQAILSCEDCANLKDCHIEITSILAIKQTIFGQKRHIGSRLLAAPPATRKGHLVKTYRLVPKTNLLR